MTDFDPSVKYTAKDIVQILEESIIKRGVIVDKSLKMQMMKEKVIELEERIERLEAQMKYVNLA